MRRHRALADGAFKVTFAGCVLGEAVVHRTIAVHGEAIESRGNRNKRPERR
jgi:hypothetical protein